MTTPPEHHDDLLERYLDELLDDDQRARFEQRLAQEPELRRAVEQQQQINAAIKRLHAAPDHAPTLEQIQPASPAAPPRRRAAPWVKLAVAAALLLVISATFVVYEAREMIWPPPPFSPPPTPTFQQIYADTLQEFEPDWVCENEAQFADSFDNRAGYPLAMLETTDAFTPLGISRRRTPLSPMTLLLLGRADGREIIVFATRLRYDKPTTLPPDSALHLFRKAIDDAVFYELSPLDAPRVLPLLRRTTLTPDQYDGQGW
ncbi:MAG: hypothetical protein CMJ49_03745 [Planctomycetaceae bacterium]|nr:hypothetical protein [Planctomycetaceae bacterium]